MSVFTKTKAIVHLYKNNKLSMMQIGKRMNLSVSGVRHHLEKMNIKRRSISDAVTNSHITQFHKKPFRLKNNLSNFYKELKTAGVMLYWGEGAKSGATVKFVNSDPEMIRVFLYFLRIICGISKGRLKALIHAYPDQNLKFLQKFWMAITKIPKKNFYKPYIHEGKVGTYKTKSVYGTLALNYSDKRLLQLILQWIDDYKQILFHNRPA